MKRRNAIKLMGALGAAPLAARAGDVADEHKGHAVMAGDKPATAGTPLQFMPQTPPDPDPLTDELAKYPKCPYCGMDRTQWNHSRHLVHYDDDLVDATCSIHCLAISLALNLDRGPRAIYGADYGVDAPIRPLVNVDEATYLIGSRLKATMSRTSKMAFSEVSAAMAERERHGGEPGDFDAALARAYGDMARDTAMIRGKRAERRRRQATPAPRMP